MIDNDSKTYAETNTGTAESITITFPRNQSISSVKIVNRPLQEARLVNAVLSLETEDNTNPITVKITESKPEYIFRFDNEVCVGSTCVTEEELRGIKTSSFTTGVIGVGNVTIPLSSFSPQPLYNRAYSLTVRRGDNNPSWRFYGTVSVLVRNGIFSTLSTLEKDKLDVSVTSAGSLLFSVVNNGFPDTFTLTLS
jgi:hypothetical protein